MEQKGGILAGHFNDRAGTQCIPSVDGTTRAAYQLELGDLTVIAYTENKFDTRAGVITAEKHLHAADWVIYPAKLPETENKGEKYLHSIA